MDERFGRLLAVFGEHVPLPTHWQTNKTLSRTRSSDSHVGKAFEDELWKSVRIESCWTRSSEVHGNRSMAALIQLRSRCLESEFQVHLRVHPNILFSWSSMKELPWILMAATAVSDSATDSLLDVVGL